MGDYGSQGSLLERGGLDELQEPQPAKHGDASAWAAARLFSKDRDQPALEVLARLIADILDPQPANVVPLRREAR